MKYVLILMVLNLIIKIKFTNLLVVITNKNDYEFNDFIFYNSLNDKINENE